MKNNDKPEQLKAIICELIDKLECKPLSKQKQILVKIETLDMAQFSGFEEAKLDAAEIVCEQFDLHTLNDKEDYKTKLADMEAGGQLILEEIERQKESAESERDKALADLASAQKALGFMNEKWRNRVDRVAQLRIELESAQKNSEYFESQRDTAMKEIHTLTAQLSEAQKENQKLNIILYHRENGLFHPDFQKEINTSRFAEMEAQLSTYEKALKMAARGMRKDIIAWLRYKKWVEDQPLEKEKITVLRLFVVCQALEVDDALHPQPKKEKE